MFICCVKASIIPKLFNKTSGKDPIPLVRSSGPTIELYFCLNLTNTFDKTRYLY